MRTFHYDEVDSTSEQAKRLAVQYPNQRLLVTATCQTAGRGRSGRVWRSPAGGAWFTLVWPIQDRIEHASVIPLLVGWAVLRSVGQVIGETHTLKLKWPNDILVGDDEEKVGGMLCEQVLPSKGQDKTAPTLIVGVGINVNFDQVELGDELCCAATSLLSATGKTFELPRLIRRCVEHMTTALEEADHDRLSATTLRELESHLAWLDQPVCLRMGDRMVTGLCRGLDSTGRIQIMVDQQLRLFDAGEVSQLRVSTSRVNPVANS